MLDKRKSEFPELDLSLEMSKLEGKLRFLATCSEKVSEWTPSFTQAETILESLGHIQAIRKDFEELQELQRKKLLDSIS